MPLSRTSVATEGTQYATQGLFVGPVDHTHSLLVDISTLTTAEVDADGYIKPGVPLQANGAIVSAPAQVIFGVVVEPVKVAAGNTALAGITDDLHVAVATIGQINRDIAEDNLGRAYTADEVAAFADSTLVLLPT